MDPNATLDGLRRLARRIIAEEDARSQSYAQSNRDTQGAELAQMFQDLDTWISKGGFLPRAWERKETT